MTRTDAHRPSAINSDDYQFVACDYFGPWAGAMFAHDRARLRLHMTATGGKFAVKHNMGTCHICGASALWVARYHHLPTNSYITTGMDCADKMDMGGRDSFDSWRKRMGKGVKADRLFHAGKAKAQAILADAGLTAAWEVYTGEQPGSWPVNTLRDMVGKLVKYGNWSEAQFQFAKKLLGQIADAPAKQEALAMAKAADAQASGHLGQVGDRLTLELTVRACPSFDSQFGTMYINIMNDAAGNVVVYKGSKELGARGDKVKVVATVKDHGEREGVKQTIVARPKVLEGVS